MSLADCTYENTPRFMPELKVARVVRVVDGDTVHLAFQCAPGKFRRISARLVGLDAAELRSKDPCEKCAARCTKACLEKLVEGTEIDVQLQDAPDKYGRSLVTLTRVSDGLNINEHLLNTWAVPYAGGRRATVDWAAVLRRNNVVVPPIAGA